MDGRALNYLKRFWDFIEVFHALDVKFHLFQFMHIWQVKIRVNFKWRKSYNKGFKAIELFYNLAKFYLIRRYIFQIFASGVLWDVFGVDIAYPALLLQKLNCLRLRERRKKLVKFYAEPFLVESEIDKVEHFDVVFAKTLYEGQCV